MASWRIDAAASGVGQLELTGTVRTYVVVFDALTGDPVPNGSSLTCTIYDSTTGLSVGTGSGTAASAGGVLVTAITVSTALVTGRIYVEQWVGTISGSSISYRRDSYATAFPMRDPLITEATITILHPELEAYPSGVTSWDRILRLAHGTIMDRVVANKRADLLTPSRLRESETWLSLAMIYEALAVFPERAALYYARFENTMATMRLTWDTDGDGDADINDAAGLGALGPAQPGGRI